MEGLRVYVGGLPPKTREQDLEEFFEGFGILKEIIIRKRFAFVEFDGRQQAEDAIFEKDGEKLLGVRVTVEMARTSAESRYQCSTSSEDEDNVSGRQKRGPLRTEHRVIVQNLSSNVSWHSLKDHMRQAAPVSYTDVGRLLPNEGIVEFASFSGMKVAIEKLDGTELYGRRIRLVEDTRDTNDDCSPPSCQSRSRTISVDSDSSCSEYCIESRSITLSPYSDSSRSGSRSYSRSRTISAQSDISSDTCFSSRRRCVSVCSDSSYSNSHSRSKSRTLSAYSDASCGISLSFRSRSQSLPAHSHSISIGSRSRTVSAYTDISHTMSCYGRGSWSLSADSDGNHSISRSRSRTLSADSNGSHRSRGQSRSPGGIGPRTPSTCCSRSHSRFRFRSRCRSDQLNFNTFNSESCPSPFFQIRSRTRPDSADATHRESRSKSRRKARKRPGSRSHSAIPAKRFLLDELL